MTVTRLAGPPSAPETARSAATCYPPQASPAKRGNRRLIGNGSGVH